MLVNTPILDGYGALFIFFLVVYLSFSTSNHNLPEGDTVTVALYIFRFLHQTTTVREGDRIQDVLYIFRFLHQTTTVTKYITIWTRCISFVFYIKPQL